MTDNRDQEEFWTDTAGPKWVRHQAAMDTLLQPVLEGVLDRASLARGQNILDIGCGAGLSTFQAADITGQATGLDISSTLLARAEQLKEGRKDVTFRKADAALHPFKPEYDHLISRFGLMFFDTPAPAFANMLKALKPGALITFATWGQIPENPFFTYAARAGKAVLGSPPKRDPDAPGPFAFRDPDRVLTILADAGFQNAQAEVTTLALTADSLEGLADLCLAIGPADVAMTHFNGTEKDRTALRAKLIETYSEFDTAHGPRIPAEINFFTATA